MTPVGTNEVYDVVDSQKLKKTVVSDGRRLQHNWREDLASGTTSQSMLRRKVYVNIKCDF